MDVQLNKTSLATALSGDILTEITERLESECLARLTLCGNKLLSNKLACHVRSVRHINTTRDFTWPFYIRGWTALKSLHVHPGRSINLAGVSYHQMAALATRVLDTLPRSLETLHLAAWPLSFESDFRAAWLQQQPNKTLSHLSGVLVLLQTFYLPHLTDFSFTPSTGILPGAHRMREWISCAKQIPLSRLSLGCMTLSTLDNTLDVTLQSLPQTLTHLHLDVNNAAEFDNRDFAGLWHRGLLHHVAAASSRDSAQQTRILPSTLVHLSLRFSVMPLTIPSDLLCGLSQLQTLKLCARKYHTTNGPDRSFSPHALSQLPSSVAKLSLDGVSTVDLHAWLTSIPEDHSSLRRLIVKNVCFPPPTQLPASFDFVTVIASHPKFWQLEALHLFVNQLLFPAPTDTTGQVNQDYERRYAGMMSMTQLRSVSAFLLRPEFVFFWRHMAPMLTPTSPMKIHCRKQTAAFFNRHWRLDEYWQGVVPIHFVTDSLALGEILRFVMKCYTTQYDKVLMDVPLLLRSAKHVMMGGESDDLALLPLLPSNTLLTTLRLTHGTPGAPFDTLIDWNAMSSIRALRSLTIETLIKVSDLNRWMQSLPKTLEVLYIRQLSNPNSIFLLPPDLRRGELPQVTPENTLTFVPPNLQTLFLCGHFAINTATFNALPESLHTVKLINMIGIDCHTTADLCRWPKRIRHIKLTTPCRIFLPQDYVHDYKTWQQWYKRSKHLEFVDIHLYKSKGRFIQFKRG